MSSNESVYPASASDPSLGGQTATGGISCEQWVLRFESEAFQAEFAWRDLQIHTAGGEDDQVFFHHPRFPNTSIFTEDASILKHPVFAKYAHLKNQLKGFEDKRATWHYFSGMLKFLGAFAILFLIGWIIFAGITNFAISRFPVEWELKLSGMLLEEFRQQEVFIEAPEVTPKLEALAKRITDALPESKYNIRVQMVNNPDPNAFALPGGIILVHTGLLAIVDSPDEIAGVLAHEIAHVQKRHGLRKLMATAGPWLAVQVLTGNDGGVLSALAQSSQILIGQTYSRDQEREADALAWDYLNEANIDPRGLEKFLRKIMTMESSGGVLNIEALSDHPLTRDRVDFLAEKWNQSSRHDGFVSLNNDFSSLVSRPVN